MSTTAVAEIVEPDTPFQKDNGTVLFLARRAELRLVMEARYPVLAPASGKQIGETPGKTVAFRANQFVCPRSGKVRLEDGREHDAGEVLAFIEGHNLIGDVNGGFWRVDPEAPAVSMAELEALVKAAEMGDEETLEGILARERAGWQREQILRVASGSLERVRHINGLVAKERELEEREAALAAGKTPAEIEAENEAKVAAQPTPPEEPAPNVLGDLATRLHEADPDAEPTE